MSIANIAQLENLTNDEEGRKTLDERYFHTHVHFIPRYEKEIHKYGATFRDPQWGKPLNIDPDCGLPIVKLHSGVVKTMRDELFSQIIK